MSIKLTVVGLPDLRRSTVLRSNVSGASEQAMTPDRPEAEPTGWTYHSLSHRTGSRNSPWCFNPTGGEKGL